MEGIRAAERHQRPINAGPVSVGEVPGNGLHKHSVSGDDREPMGTQIRKETEPFRQPPSLFSLGQGLAKAAPKGRAWPLKPKMPQWAFHSGLPGAETGRVTGRTPHPE